MPGTEGTICRAVAAQLRNRRLDVCLGRELRRSGDPNAYSELVGLYRLNRSWIAERGARLAGRDDRAYREYSREEQRRQEGCPARKALLIQSIQATSSNSERRTPELIPNSACRIPIPSTCSRPHASWVFAAA